MPLENPQPTSTQQTIFSLPPPIAPLLPADISMPPPVGSFLPTDLSLPPPMLPTDISQPPPPAQVLRPHVSLPPPFMTMPPPIFADTSRPPPPTPSLLSMPPPNVSLTFPPPPIPENRPDLNYAAQDDWSARASLPKRRRSVSSNPESTSRDHGSRSRSSHDRGRDRHTEKDRDHRRSSVHHGRSPDRRKRNSVRSERIPNRREQRTYSRERSSDCRERSSNYRERSSHYRELSSDCRVRRSERRECKSKSRYGNEPKRHHQSPVHSLCREDNERNESRHQARYLKSQTQAKSDSPPAHDKEKLTDRKKILLEYREDYCRNMEEIEARIKSDSQSVNPKVKTWYRNSPAELFYEPTEVATVVKQTERLAELCKTFEMSLIERGRQARPAIDELPPLKPQEPKLCKHRLEVASSSSSSSDEEDMLDKDGLDGEVDRVIQELTRKQAHPRRLHPELWYNHTGEMNGGPLCRCNSRARRLGMRHGVFADEPSFPHCDITLNNIDKLFHYRITVSPATNFLIKTPTIISHDEHEFLFSGFSMFSHYKLPEIPMCKVIRFNIEYTILFVEEQAPQNFSIQELDLFEEYLFTELLELIDLDLGKGADGNCSQFHFMPRFVRNLRDNGSEILSMCEVLNYLLSENGLLIPPSELKKIHKMDHYNWQKFIDKFQGMIVTYPGKKPCSIRVDQLDRNPPESHHIRYRSSGDKTNRDPVVQAVSEKKSEEPLIETDANQASCCEGDQKVQQKYFEFDDDESINEETISKLLADFKDDSKSGDSNNRRCVSEQKGGNSRTDRGDLRSDRSNGGDRTSKDCNRDDEWRYSFYPEIVHFGIRPPQLSYAGNPEYQKVWRFCLKYRHLMANMSKPTFKDKQKLQEAEAKLQQMRTQSKMKRDVTVALSSQGFYTTGLMCDVVQHAMLIPVLVRHLRFHKSLDSLEQTINYKFESRALLQKALTHPSYRENFGTNPDHARNSLTNCGIRQPEYGDRKIHYTHTRKKGINILINIMSRFGEKSEKESAINHNERLEFLGDAVVEFVSSVHLFLMFPGVAEGGLATYRAAIVQNQHLALLAKKINLDKFMLIAHGADLCRDIVMRHAMANCFEALMGAVYLDGGLKVADDVFAMALWLNEPKMMATWIRKRLHPLQEQEPLGDRQYIKDFEFLQKLVNLENSMGIYFKHIRLLARAFTDRSVGYTHLTLGSNQRLEFLGDTVLQLVVSERLYRHFPGHHEGHLSLLRSSLVNNRTQAIICADLNMAEYAVYNNPKAKPTTKKHKADLLEAFLGALYVDKGLKYCEVFCNVVLFPRLELFITNQDWNDPKSKLQQCCLTLRSIEGGEPDIPIYKVIESLGPTNTRMYTVAVYFGGVRLAKATGLSIQEAEMNAAKEALAVAHAKFPQLDHQNRAISNTKKKPSNAKVGTSKAHLNLRKKKFLGQVPKAYKDEEEDDEDEISDDMFLSKIEADDSETEEMNTASTATKTETRTMIVTSLINDMQALKEDFIKSKKYESLCKINNTENVESDTD